jgi:sensor histidine kinase YesM
LESVLTVCFLAYTLAFVSLVPCRIPPHCQDEQEARWIEEQFKQQQQQRQQQQQHQQQQQQQESKISLKYIAGWRDSAR